MIEFFVDKKTYNFLNITYHHQKYPKPGGHLYKITIRKNEVFEKILNIYKTNGDELCKKISQDKYFIFILIDIIESLTLPESEINWDIKWVFNNITNVTFIDGILTIEGEASKALSSEEFDNLNRKINSANDDSVPPAK